MDAPVATKRSPLRIAHACALILASAGPMASALVANSAKDSVSDPVVVWAPAPAPAEMESAVSAATEAAKHAWALATQVEKQAAENNKVVPLLKAAVATARSAASAAKDQDDKASRLLAEAQQTANQTAMAAAQEYLMEVRTAAASPPEPSPPPGPPATAADPYLAEVARGERGVESLVHRAQVMAVASNHLVAQSSEVARAAITYQSMGQVVEANKLMLKAHTLAEQGENMRHEAQRMYASAVSTNDALPAYRLAATQASAGEAAAASAGIVR